MPSGAQDIGAGVSKCNHREPMSQNHGGQDIFIGESKHEDLWVKKHPNHEKKAPQSLTCKASSSTCCGFHRRAACGICSGPSVHLPSTQNKKWKAQQGCWVHNQIHQMCSCPPTQCTRRHPNTQWCIQLRRLAAPFGRKTTEQMLNEVQAGKL